MTNHTSPKTAVLLVNLGSPDAPTAAAVKPYLAEFLGDKRVIDLPKILWYPILYGIILRVRPPKTAAAYRSIWTADGSPLIATTKAQADALAKRFAADHVKNHVDDNVGNDANNVGQNVDNVGIFYAMRYGNPSIAHVLADVVAAGYEKLLVFPLYPQYSRTTTETVRDKVSEVLNQRGYELSVDYIEKYYDEPRYINALANRIQAFEAEHGKPEKLIFSYHGIPQRYIDKGDVYDQHCIATTEAVAEVLGLAKTDYLTTFQSRFGFDTWLQPYTDETLKQLAKDGIKKVHILSPAFSADCLETLEELEEENREYFETADGQDPDNTDGRTYRYIPALNADIEHIDVLEFIIRQRLSP